MTDVASDNIIEGVEYIVVQNSVERAGSKAADGIDGIGGRADVGTVSEYARALQTFSADRFDGMAALEIAILGWLDAKRGRSGSERIWRTYADILAAFRAALQQEGLDLDGPVTPVALVAQAWAGSRISAPAGTTSGDGGRGRVPSVSTNPARDRTVAVAPATYNQRLASVSSFYKYARKQGILQDNPIERVERRRVQAYAGSRALEAEYVKRALASHLVAMEQKTGIRNRPASIIRTKVGSEAQLMPFVNVLQLCSALQSNEAFPVILFVLMRAKPQEAIGT